jgi:hypothetical protein
MFAIIYLLGTFIADLFKSRRRLEVENLFLRHQLNIILRRPPPSAPGTLLKRDRSLLRVRGLRLPAELSDRLRERSRREGTTVHGALTAALVFAGRDIRREWRKAPVRVVSPVNNRTILGRGDDCALSIIFP